ncbi:MAG: glycosyltransferase family 9 protein [bacterium]
MFLQALIIFLRLKGSLRRKRSLDDETVRSVLIVELTRLGDVITMIPAVYLLARRFRNATLHLLVDRRYAAFLANVGLPCEVHGVERFENVSDFFKTVGAVRKLKVDLTLSMSPPKRNAAITLMSGAHRKAGYLTYVDTLTPYLELTAVESFGCNLVSRQSYSNENIEERALKVCRALGIPTGDVPRFLHLDEKLVATKLLSLVKKKNISSRSFVVLHPFSGWEYRSWDLSKFNELAAAIVSSLHCDVVFLCERSEEPMLASSKAEFKGRNDVFFFASDDLMDTSVVLKEAAVVVCNDSGPMHLAATLGARVVGLFGPASPELTGPRAGNCESIFKQVECSPCDQYNCIRPSNSCMTLISTNEVLQSVIKQLSVAPAAEAVANA